MLGLKEKICQNLLMTFSEYEELVKSAPSRYKVYTIPKKSNPFKRRMICHPAKELKLVQRHLISKYFQDYPIHDSATAYLKGKNAYLNSLQHVENPYLVKIDFKNFFNSILSSDFKNFIDNNNIFNFSKDEIEQLSHFLFWYNFKRRKLILSIGAPSSPMISNILLFHFDNEISDYCGKEMCVYTRYADDIAISGKSSTQVNKCYNFVLSNLALTGIENIEINESKTRFLSKKGRRAITGFIISNEGKSSLGREKKKLIRSMIHRILIKDDIEEENVNYLKGILGHIKHFDNEYFTSLENTYGPDFFKIINKK